MTSKFLVAAAFALALVPTVANADAQRDRRATGDVAIGTHDAAPQQDARSNAGDRVVTFLTRVIIPDFNDRRPPIAYADNPELIGNRYGSTNPSWNK